MRLLARMGCTVAGLALLASSAAQAGMPIPAPGPYNTQVKKKSPKTTPKKFCAPCQAEQMLAKGLRVPTPPPLPAGSPVKGERCFACGAPTAVVFSGKLYRSEPPTMVANNAPGRAVVGGETAEMMAFDGGPMPIGVVAPRLASAMPAGPGGGRGARDAAVMPTSALADPIAAPVSGRPHILSHLTPVTTLGRARGDRWTFSRVDKHASIPYGSTAADPVTDVPMSVLSKGR